jgi:hypothetical protein
MLKHFAFVAVAALSTAGCFQYVRESSRLPINPSSTASAGLLGGGQWGSVQSFPGTGTLQESCTNFKWTVWQSTPTSANGSFTATCWSNMAVTGTATAALAGSDVTWSATASATAPGGGPCAITLSGTAVLQPDQITLNYTGTTCLGNVSGTEILKKS